MPKSQFQLSTPLYLCLIALAMAACQPNKNSQSSGELQTDAVVDSLTTELEEIYASGMIKGFGVGIVNDQGVLYQKGFGYANVSSEERYTANSLQNIASVSKTLLGLALMKAIEMDKLGLDDPINKYLPFEVKNPYSPSKAITIRHLATHTSTIVDSDLYGQKSYLLKDSSDYELAKSIPSSEEFNLPSSAMEMGDFLREFLSADGLWYNKESYLDKEPGELYEYTNVGATLAAFVIEQAVSQSYDSFTKQHILEPLNMTSSAWSFDSISVNGHSKLYTVEGEEIPFYELITYPDGGLITSIADMSKYLSELIKGYSGTGKLLTTDSYQVIFSELLTEENFEERDSDRPFDDEYNSGIFMGHTPIGYLGHMGGDPGVSTFMFFNPKTKIGKLLFVNTDLNEEGAKEFYSIWNTLGSFEERLLN